MRGVEVHGEAVGSARAGMRCALNLSGVGQDRPRAAATSSRAPARSSPSHLIDASFRYLAHLARRRSGRRSRVLVHHATAQVMATLVLVDRERLEPGEEGLVQLHLDIAAPLAPCPAIASSPAASPCRSTTAPRWAAARCCACTRPSCAAPRTQASEMSCAPWPRPTPTERIALEVHGAGPAGSTLDDLVAPPRHRPAPSWPPP